MVQGRFGIHGGAHAAHDRAGSPAGVERFERLEIGRGVERLDRDALERLPGQRVGALAAELLGGERAPLVERLVAGNRPCADHSPATRRCRRAKDMARHQRRRQQPERAGLMRHRQAAAAPPEAASRCRAPPGRSRHRQQRMERTARAPAQASERQAASHSASDREPGSLGEQPVVELHRRRILEPVEIPAAQLPIIRRQRTARPSAGRCCRCSPRASPRRRRRRRG